MNTSYIRWFETLSAQDGGQVGGKNASLGEMVSRLESEGIPVPPGFATTADAFRLFVRENGIEDEIRSQLKAHEEGRTPLARTGRRIRALFTEASFPEEVAQAIKEAYKELGRRLDVDDPGVAVRSSATAEDLPEASFAGQQETFLNVSGAAELLSACKRCYASLFTDRAITYRREKGFDHMEVALSVGIQKMVRSDKSGSGVMFSIDTETGFPDAVLINAAWGLGETVVQGSVTPDEYRVFKPLAGKSGLVPVIEKTLGAKEQKMVYTGDGSRTTKIVSTPKPQRQAFVLEDQEIVRLAAWAAKVEEHYERPMDLEWAKDGETGDLYIVQARPETVESAKSGDTLKTFRLNNSPEPLLTGVSIGQAIAAGPVRRIQSPDDPEQIENFEAGSILVTEMTDPDWVPLMKKAAGIITDAGGRTCHAAIISRELGIPAVVGTGDGTGVLKDDQEVTLSCAQGDEGYVYEGILDFETEDIDLSGVPETRTRIMLNIASPSAAFRWWRLPCRGIGLARMEFIINNVIQIHPMALVHFDRLEDDTARERISRLTRGYEDKPRYFVDHLARGIAKIAASQYPDPVIVRFSDFKTNEYADLIGGAAFEKTENNPMLGFRGASRYGSEAYGPGFALECRALKQAREVIGLDNIVAMIPFCRTVAEARRALEAMAKNGLERGKQGLAVYMMAEIPANIILAHRFAPFFDGFSIGSNDLTQLILGVDRDSAYLADLFDEQDEAVKQAIRDLIAAAHDAGIKVGICGQAPSDHPGFAEFLVKQGIDAISLNPDSILPVIRRVARAEQES